MFAAMNSKQLHYEVVFFDNRMAQRGSQILNDFVVIGLHVNLG